jgi:pyruvate formate lyase activating enzyme
MGSDNKVNKFGRRIVDAGVIEAQWWHGTNGGKVRCDLCPRGCALAEGQRGFCFVREARGGSIALNSYGRASGFAVDPIEKKPLNHFLPGTTVFSFGTAGCNLGCRFCQNWEISKARKNDRLNQWADPEQVVDAALRVGSPSIAFTYNEPIIFAEYAIDCAKEAHDRGLRTVAVSAGYITEQARHEFFAVMDGANIDLKAFSEQFYHKLCSAHLDAVLETLRYLKNETTVWFEVTTLVIPGYNDSDDELARLTGWFVENLGPEVPLHFSAFHPTYKLSEVAPTSAFTLNRARNRALSAGIKHVYTGNIHDKASQSTYCAGCGELLIERDWYRLGRYQLDSRGACKKCGRTLAGIFGSGPGSL